jgi:transmembrane sensor
MIRIFPVMKGLHRLKVAAGWRTRIEEDVRLNGSDEFQSWLKNKENQAAYVRVGQIWDIVEDHQSAPEIISIRREAMQHARAAMHPRWNWNSKLTWSVVSAAIILVVGVIAIINPLAIGKPVVYATPAGVRQVVALEDGSRIWLDASSAVSVQPFSRHFRRLFLINGRARFDVAHDKTRPFTVSVGRETAVALGTSFDIECLNSKVLVTVREGHVLVNRPLNNSERNSSISLLSGQELITTQDGHATVARVDLRAANAWEQGTIVLNDQTLGEAVEQMNRYLATPMQVDPEIAKMRVSGVFNGGDLHSFVSALTNYFPIEAGNSKKGGILLQKRG